MNIGIDATLLREDRITGVERYIINLVEHLVHQNTTYKIYVFFKKSVFSKLGHLTDKFEPVIIKVDNRILVDQIILPYKAWKLRIDLMHFPVFGAPLLYRKHTVLTIHDAAFWLYPETISKGGKFYYKPLFKQAIMRANKIITVSENSKQDLVRIFNLDVNKIVVIYEAVDQIFESNPTEVSLRKYYMFDEPYILSVGTIEPRKNLTTLLNAFKIIRLNYNHNVKLLLIGRHGWINKLKIPEEIRNDVIFTGFIEEELLPAIYKKASVYAFPSLYEGFGFPLLEAFACGTPVVSSLSSSLPEIGGDACEYADPYSEQDFACKINAVLVNSLKRTGLIEKGYKRIKYFDWKECAKQTLVVYSQALNDDIKKN